MTINEQTCFTNEDCTYGKICNNGICVNETEVVDSSKTPPPPPARWLAGWRAGGGGRGGRGGRGGGGGGAGWTTR